MSEIEWVKSIYEDIEKHLRKSDISIKVTLGHRLPYSNMILSYKGKEPYRSAVNDYETDILISELSDSEVWTPRVVIETKINSVTTHDAITYSQKAQTHKSVHPYLRYGILIGNRKNYPLPGRLFRHGQQFDFMLSWKKFISDKIEFKTLIEILNDEIKASRILEEIIFNSRSSKRDRYISLHKPLKLT